MDLDVPLLGGFILEDSQRVVGFIDNGEAGHDHSLFENGAGSQSDPVLWLEGVEQIRPAFHEVFLEEGLGLVVCGQLTDIVIGFGQTLGVAADVKFRLPGVRWAVHSDGLESCCCAGFGVSECIQS